MEVTTTQAAYPLRARPGLRHHVLALFFALLGGVFGIFGAAVTELASGGGGLAVAFVAAPIIEEAMKPLGVYILLAKWPIALRNQVYTAVLAAISGISFGLIEALAYVNVYVPDPPQWFVIYRFTIPLALHATASFIYGFGINKALLDWASKGSRFPRRTLRLYLIAVVMHGLFNIVVGVLSLSGALDVD
jgi:RsiW-degrading membrane proteinase PrsW (M82 family)